MVCLELLEIFFMVIVMTHPWLNMLDTSDTPVLPTSTEQELNPKLPLPPLVMSIMFRSDAVLALSWEVE